MSTRRTAPPALGVAGLTVSFRRYSRRLAQTDVVQVRDLDLELRPRELLAVVGASGSGKSLLAHAVLGVLPHNATATGAMTWFGEPLTPARQRSLRGRELGYIPQNLDALDPLMRVAALVGGGRHTSDAVRDVLERYQLTDAARRYPHELSGGMARRVLVAAAVIDRPRVVIADEPTPGMSPELADATVSHFRELVDAGTSVLMITHDIELAVRTADRIAVLHGGRCVEASSVDRWSDVATLEHPFSRSLWRAMPEHGMRAVGEPESGTEDLTC